MNAFEGMRSLNFFIYKDDICQNWKELPRTFAREAVFTLVLNQTDYVRL